MPQEYPIKSMLESGLIRLDKHRVRDTLVNAHPADIAEAIEEFEPTEARQLLDLFRLSDRAELFGFLQLRTQVEIAGEMTRNELAALFSRMEPDERADLYNRLGDEERMAILPGLAQAEREDLRRLASYEEGTAGALMTSDYATLREHWTVSRALTQLRLEAPDKETIYQAYVIDAERKLVGCVSLRQLILARPTRTIAEFMRTDVVTANTRDDQEEITQTIRRYDLLALPVLDSEERLVGIVTYDDAMDAAVEEATEDAQKSASVDPLDVPITEASLWELYRKRIFWLVLLVFGALLSGIGIAHYEETIEQHIVLIFFLPLLIGAGGNAGSQSAALMVRSLATGEVEMKDWAKLLGREVLVASCLGATMGGAVFLLGLYRGGAVVGLVVALSMLVIVLLGALVGMCLPFLLSRMKLDPATASGPLVTTLADASGVVIYLTIATLIMGL